MSPLEQLGGKIWKTDDAGVVRGDRYGDEVEQSDEEIAIIPATTIDPHHVHSGDRIETWAVLDAEGRVRVQIDRATGEPVKMEPGSGVELFYRSNAAKIQQLIMQQKK